MAKSSRTVTPASQWGGVNGPQGAVDAYAVTDAVGAKRIKAGPTAFVQNTTASIYEGPCGFRGILVAAYASAHVAPIASGGTLAYNVYIGATKVATIDPQTLTADVAAAMTLQAANDALVAAATDIISVDSVASNNAIGTAATGPVVVLVFRPLEASTGAGTITGTVGGL